MNRRRDTDEGRPQPSVWPVYLAAGVLALTGILGVIAAVGLVRLRPWG